MGWLIALGIITLLAVLPLGVSVRYDQDGALVRVIAGPLKITLFPRPKKEKKPKKEKNPAPKVGTKKKADTPVPEQMPPEPKPAEPEVKQEQPKAAEAPKQPEMKAEPKSAQEPKPEKKKGGSLTDFLPLVMIAIDFLGDFRRKLRVNVLELKLILAADDPCDLAVNYGRAWSAVGNLLPRLEKFLVIQKRDINVECDFTASQTLVIARLDLTITLGRLLAAVFVFAFRAIVEFLKIMNKRKGGAVNEPKSS